MIRIFNILAAISLWIFGSAFYSAQAQIRSSNAATYITVDISPGKYHVLSLPFVAPPGVAALLPSVALGSSSNLPIGTTIVFYDNSNQVFASNSETLFPFGWFPDSADLALKNFWLFVPDEGQGNFGLHLYGNSPATNTLAHFSQFMQEPQGENPISNNLMSYLYPQEILWTATDLAGKAGVGDTLTQYDPNLGYFGSTTLFPFGWFPADNVLVPGKAYFFSVASPGPLTWNETKPYVWP